MSAGEVLTRLTIWIALLAYAAGAATYALSLRRSKWDSAARLAWTIACVSLLAHTVFAFHFYHGWSHSAAYRDTARQTEEVFRLNWGGGLYVNYALLILWILDVVWWWLRGLDAYRRRPWSLVIAWHGFLIFVVFNATVIFESGFVRWAGLCMCLGLVLAWWHAARENSTRRPAVTSPTVAED